MTLFLSHASEDKGFVRALAEALRTSGQTVWFDEYELSLGDSLLTEIDKGLRKSDYGVVVLSKAFFSKKWPKAELDGLFALETTERKVILPIWKDVTEEDVKAFSLILSGRLAISASEGVERVVAAINQAVSIAGRAMVLHDMPIVDVKLSKIKPVILSHWEYDKKRESEDGKRLIQSAARTVITTVSYKAVEFRDSLPLSFSFESGPRPGYEPYISISGPFHIGMQLEFVEQSLVLQFYVIYHELDLNNHWILIDEQYIPYFADIGEVEWRCGASVYSNDGLAAYTLEVFLNTIERSHKRENLPTGWAPAIADHKRAGLIPQDCHDDAAIALIMELGLDKTKTQRNL